MEKQNKLEAKDLINIGIFTVVYFMIEFAVSMLGYIPIFILLLVFLCPLVCGVPSIFYIVKVKKFGVISITGILLGLLYMLMGGGIVVLAFGIIFGFLGDLIIKKGKYEQWKYISIGYSVFSFWIVGCVARLFIGREAYLAEV